MTTGRTMATVARTSLLRATRRHSTYVVSALALAPALLGALLGAQGHGATATAGPIAIRLIAPLLVVSLVAGPVGEAFESRTMVYYFTRPVPRAAVLAGEWLAYAVLAAGVLAVGGGFLAIANALTGSADVGSLVRIPLGLAAEGVALVGFSLGIAALFPKHPLVAAIGLLTLTEGALAALPGAFQYASISYHAGQLTGMASDAADAGTGTASPVSLLVSAAVLLVYGLVPLVVSMVVVTDRDLA